MRKCDTCTACCTSLRIEALNKPAGVQCEHVCKHRCSIYTERPTACREFECLWLHYTDKEIPRKFRPDRSGAMLATSYNAGEEILQVHISNRKTYQKSGLRAWIQQRFVGFTVLEVEQGEWETVGMSPRLIEQIQSQRAFKERQAIR